VQPPPPPGGIVEAPGLVHDKRSEARALRFALQREAAKLASAESRVSRCGWIIPRHKSGAEVWMIQAKEGGEKGQFKGHARCGSVWTCPVCAETKSIQRRKELEDHLKRAEKAGLFVAFLTLTVPHTAKDLPGDLLEKIANARRNMQNRKPWKRLMKELGHVGTIRALETTWSRKNGYHFHTHELLFFEKPYTEGSNAVPVGELLERRKAGDLLEGFPLVSLILAEWAKACVDAELDCPNEKGAHVRDAQFAAIYASKWGLEHELTGHTVKTARGKGKLWGEHREKGSTPWELLKLSNQGDREAAGAWRRYADAIEGKRQLTYSKGLSKRLKTTVLPEDQLDLRLETLEEGENVKQRRKLGTIDPGTWAEIYFGGHRAAILSYAEALGWYGVHTYILEALPQTPFAKEERERFARLEARGVPPDKWGMAGDAESFWLPKR